MLGQINKLANAIEVSKYNNIISKKNAMNEKFKNYSNEELKNELLKMKDAKINMPLALELISQLSRNFFGLSPYDSQLQASLVLDSGNVAELGTGEGKTLSIVISSILNFLRSDTTHIVTANEYLVERDYFFSKDLFDFLGISSTLINDQSQITDKKETYKTDVVYSISKHLVFDYLNNNRIQNVNLEYEERRDVAIIDEIDFVLIDEARTPIVLSGAVEADSEKYNLFQKIQKDFVGLKKEEGFVVNQEDFVYSNEMLDITENGYKKLEKALIKEGLIEVESSLYEGDGFSYIKYLERALKANYLFLENISYLKMNDTVVPINQQTGRLQEGRRFSDGLQQALEAKEGFSINADSKVLGQTTLQNYFKKYKKLAGTTGTAETESAEFKEFYNLKVLSIKPQKQSKREDLGDVIFLNAESRNKDIIKKTKENIKNNRPTLIGTQTLEDSELISDMLIKENIDHNLLNAKNHEKEAYIIAQAGKSGVVTIATNMAGRGTDIVLGGNKEIEIEIGKESGIDESVIISKWEKDHKEVVLSGGLSILGVARGSSRRFDNQLIGRSGRQGDPGETRFYLTLEDSMFMGMSVNYLKSYWEKESKDEGLSFGMLTKLVREAQKSIEGMGFNGRKNLFKFDNINSEQREIFYNWRKKILSYESLEEVIEKYFMDSIKIIVTENLEKEEFFANDFSEMERDFEKRLNIAVDVKTACEKNNLEDEEDFVEFMHKTLMDSYNEKMTAFEEDDRKTIEKDLLLQIMDQNYAENISNLESMRMSTSLRAYAQKNPLDEYQQEALEMFSNLVKDIKIDFCLLLSKFTPYSLLEKKIEMEQRKKEIEYLQAKVNLSDIDKVIPRPITGAGV